MDGGGIKNYFLALTWKHKDNTPTCLSHTIEEVVMPPVIGKDYWQTDFPEGLSEVKSNPNCKLLYSQITIGPEMRKINGQSIFRDQWE